MVSLRITHPDGKTLNYPISKDEITIGRSRDNHITLKDDAVSRHHAKLINGQEGFVLNDLGSFNGTKVNDRSIRKTLLKNEDRILIGRSRLIFYDRDSLQPSLSESLVLATDGDFDNGDRQIVQSTLKDGGHKGSQSLLVAVDSQKIRKESEAPGHVEITQASSPLDEELTSLERANKVLFVLYEISRQLNSIQDFSELLDKIMDLIFMVIDADYGFLILRGDDNKELIPVVVKSKEGGAGDKSGLKASQTIINKVIRDKVALLTSNAMADSRLDHAQSLLIKQIRSAMCVPLWKKDNIIGVIQLDSIRLDNQFTEDDLELLKAIGSQMAMIIEQASLNEQIREEEQMRSRLERFHSPQVIDMILRGSQEAKDNIMEPKDLTATILFTDINGFTRLSEQMPPREINMVLNEYFSKMTDIIFKYDGTLDKYIGDGLMAVFGAPMEKEDDSERAIKAALEMRDELSAMMGQEERERKFTFRVGINTGRVVAGNIGSPMRMDYTIIGDPVNIASRLESIAAPSQILIGEETYLLVRDKFKIRDVGPKRVKGKSKEIKVYEVL